MLEQMKTTKVIRRKILKNCFQNDVTETQAKRFGKLMCLKTKDCHITFNQTTTLFCASDKQLFIC